MTITKNYLRDRFTMSLVKPVKLLDFQLSTIELMKTVASSTHYNLNASSVRKINSIFFNFIFFVLRSFITLDDLRVISKDGKRC